MKKSFKLTLSISLIYLVISCSNPLEKVYTESGFDKDIQDLKGEISDEELSLLAIYIGTSEFAGERVDGKSYKQILLDAKNLQAQREKEEEEQRLLAEKAKKEEEERTTRLNSVLTVSLFYKGFVALSYDEYITYKFAFENKSEKDIKAFKGLMVIKDLFDSTVKEISITYDEGVPAGKIEHWDATTSYNQFIDTDNKLKLLDIEKAKITWIPEKIIFEDGTELE